MSVSALPLPVNPVVTREQYERDKFTIKLIGDSEGAINFTDRGCSGRRRSGDATG